MYAIIATQSQAESCDNRFCDIRIDARKGGMTQEEINRRLEALDAKNIELAEMLGITEDKVSKSRSKELKRRWQPDEAMKLVAWLSSGSDMSKEPDQASLASERAYLPIEVLPTYAGAGGGGSGVGDRQTALISRALIADELRGKASDFLLLDVRGDSMEPDFYHGDQLLIDKRDVSPSQPGPFALWDGEWGEYVVKNVERLSEGRVRIFSSNLKYSSAEVMHEETRIIGRPVWFARRL